MTAKANIVSIKAHGENLLVIFPGATERDPVKLCKKLRKIEHMAARIGLRLCNGPEYPEGALENTKAIVMQKLSAVLGAHGVPVFINQDPRGYALKIRSEAAAKLTIHRDMGGYGIIAPEF